MVHHGPFRLTRLGLRIRIRAIWAPCRVHPDTHPNSLCGPKFVYGLVHASKRGCPTSAIHSLGVCGDFLVIESS